MTKSLRLFMGIFDFCRLIDSRVKTTPKGNWRDIDE